MRLTEIEPLWTRQNPASLRQRLAATAHGQLARMRRKGPGAPETMPTTFGRLLNVDIMRERCRRVEVATERYLGKQTGSSRHVLSPRTTLSAIEEAAVAMTSAQARLSAAAASLCIKSLGPFTLEHAGQHRTLSGGDVFETVRWG